jgi:hypothetical protein
MTPANDPTPEWTAWSNGDSDIHAELQVLARLILAQKSESIARSSTAETFDRSRVAGLVDEDQHGIRFVDAALRDQYVAREATITGDWTTAESFASQIAELQHRTVGFRARQTVGTLAIQLLLLGGVDVLGLVSQLASMSSDERHGFWSVYSVLCDALPTIETASSRLVEAVLPVIDASSSDMTSGLIYSAVEKWARRRAESANGLVTHLVTAGIPSLLPAAVSALSSFDRAKAHQVCVNLANASSTRAMSGAALVAIAGLPYDQPGDQLLQETVSIIAECLRNTPADLEPMVAQACFSLVKVTDVAAQFIVTLSHRTDSRTRHVLALGLFQNGDERSKDEWWQTALFNLAPTPAADGGTFKYLDYCASRLAQHDPRLAIQFVERVALTRESDFSDDCGELLDGTMSKLHKTAVTDLEDAITEWFGSRSTHLHRLAAGAVHRHNRDDEPSRYLALSSRRLFRADDDYIMGVLTHATGWVIGGAPLAALLASSLRTSGLSAPLRSFVRELLTDVALYNYPKGAGDFLRKELARGVLFPVEADIVVAALKASDAYYKAISELPELLELRTPSHREYLQRLDRLAESARIAEQARSQSVMMSLIHRVPLKYGRASFAFHDGQLSSPEPLHSFSYGVELPRGEVLDPIGQLILRINLRHDRDGPGKHADAGEA